MSQKGRPNSKPTQATECMRKHRFCDPENRDNLGFLLRIRVLAIFEPTFELLGKQPLTGLCVAKYFRKLLGAHVSKCQFDYDLT